jgi:5-methylcytosine-specific restriction endonuclease McrA
MDCDEPLKQSRKRKIIDYMIIDDDNNISKKKYKKKYISSTLKRLVWNKWIGEEIGKAKCTCCSVTFITQLSFHAGHIIAEVNGGETIVSNLKPICQNCNSSMGSKNMNDFMKTFQ